MLVNKNLYFEFDFGRVMSLQTSSQDENLYYENRRTSLWITSMRDRDEVMANLNLILFTQLS